MQRSKSLKICGLILLVLLGMDAFSQHNTTSPFSRFGLGDIANSGKGRSVAMGGVGIALSSSSALNNLNPASYGALDSMSFVYELGVNAHFINMKSARAKSSSSDMNFDYFRMAFPVTKWWRMSMGVNPYSNVGFYMKMNKDVTSSVTNEFLYNQESIFEGKGGVNKAYFSQSFIPVKGLYLGLNFSYVFGQITRTNTIDFLDSNGLSLPSYRNSLQKEITTVKDITFDFGFQYKTRLNDDYAISVGGIFAPKKSFSTDLDRTIGGVRDTLTYNMDIPTKFGGGLGLYIKDNITIGFDYTNEQWSDVKSNEGEIFKNNETYALGFEIIPNRRSLKSYFGLVSYRFGVHYTDSYIKIGNESIKDYGVTFGFGFPLRRSSTYINLAFDLGRRGSVSNTLIEEDYAKLSLSFSMFSKWFYKQKYE
jgi:hypothetical protein